jgi:hypothetical protein
VELKHAEGLGSSLPAEAVELLAMNVEGVPEVQVPVHEDFEKLV